MRAVILLLGVVIGTTLAASCSSGWVASNRTTGLWCMKVYTAYLNQDAAEAKCQALGATLTGIESQEELTKVAAQGKTEMLKTTWKFGQLRLGGQRCSLNDPFYWVDGRTIGTDGFKWSVGEPYQGSTDGVPHTCAMMWMYVTGGWVTTRNHGEIFSNACATTKTDRYVGYVCGKVAA